MTSLLSVVLIMHISLSRVSRPQFYPVQLFCLLACLTSQVVITCIVPWILENIVGNKERHLVIPSRARMKTEHDPDLSTY